MSGPVDIRKAYVNKLFTTLEQVRELGWDLRICKRYTSIFVPDGYEPVARNDILEELGEQDMGKIGDWTIPEEEVMVWAFGKGWKGRKMDECLEYFEKNNPRTWRRIQKEWVDTTGLKPGARVDVQFVLDRLEQYYQK